MDNCVYEMHLVKNPQIGGFAYVLMVDGELYIAAGWAATWLMGGAPMGNKTLKSLFTVDDYKVFTVKTYFGDEDECFLSESNFHKLVEKSKNQIQAKRFEEWILSAVKAQLKDGGEKDGKGHKCTNLYQ